MNQEQYRELCKACDHALLAPDSSIERISIPWLHVVREHPVFLTNYADLFENTSYIKAFSHRLLRNIRNVAVLFRQIGKAFVSDGHPWHETIELPEQIDVLFVSHLLNASYIGKADDFYFGKLPNELAAQGYSTAIALIKHFDEPNISLMERWKNSGVPRIIISDTIRLSDEIDLHRRLKKESRLLKIMAQKISGLLQRVLIRAAQEALSNSSLTTLRMAKQIAILTAKLQPKVIMITHEGHAWERVTFAAARTSVPAVQCVGYQHAALFRLQHAIRRNLSKQYNPDQIFTAGMVSKVQLERTPALKGIMISVLGSSRAPEISVTTKINNAHINRKSKKINNPTCLILPEGTISESNLLFVFSLACAKMFPKIQFIWRLHPLISYRYLIKNNSKLNVLPDNIVLSHGTLAEDFAKSYWTLYRGTTTVVQAVMAGLRPIYLQLPGELLIDPLYELEVWRTRVKNVAEFQQTIYQHINTIEELSEPDLQVAQRYCKSFYLPSDVRVLTRLIPRI